MNLVDPLGLATQTTCPSASCASDVVPIRVCPDSSICGGDAIERFLNRQAEHVGRLQDVDWVEANWVDVNRDDLATCPGASGVVDGLRNVDALGRVVTDIGDRIAVMGLVTAGIGGGVGQPALLTGGFELARRGARIALFGMSVRSLAGVGLGLAGDERAMFRSQFDAAGGQFLRNLEGADDLLGPARSALVEEILDNAGVAECESEQQGD